MISFILKIARVKKNVPAAVSKKVRCNIMNGGLARKY